MRKIFHCSRPIFAWVIFHFDHGRGSFVGDETGASRAIYPEHLSAAVD